MKSFGKIPLIRCALVALSLSAMAATAAPPADKPVFLGQHIMYTQTYNTLQDDLFDGLRIWDAEGTQWAKIEPKKGQFDFERFDKHVDGAVAHHLNLMYTLGQTPQWASARPEEKGQTGPGASAEPADMGDWARYVRTVATRYKGKISAYEIMNEPRVPDAFSFKTTSPGYFSGSAAKLGEMTRIAAEEVHKVDPGAKIVCPSMTGGEFGLKRLDAFLKTGAGKYCDVIGFHYYLSNFKLDELREMVEGTKKIKAHYGLAQLPIWDTEIGFMIAEAGFNLQPKDTKGPASKSFQSDEAARLAAKIVVLSHYLGVERTYWFAHDTSWMGSTVADKRLNRLNNFGKSLLVFRHWVSGRYLRNCVDGGSSLFCEVHDKDGKVGAIYWGGGKTPAAWAKQGYTQVDFLNGASGPLKDFDASTALPRISEDVIFLH